MKYNVPTQKILGEIIKERRKLRGLTQFDLAELVGVDERTVRLWEAGCVAVIRSSNVEKLISVLDIPRGLLYPQTSLTFEEIEKMERDAPLLLANGSYISVLKSSEALVPIFKEGHMKSLPRLIRAEYLAANAVATVKNDPALALRIYRSMEKHAQQLDRADPAATMLARMGQADMYRRLEKFSRAQDLLESVTTQFVDRQHPEAGFILGNCYQWLARVQLAQRNVSGMMNSLERARTWATQIAENEHQTSSWPICFCELSVVEEFAKSNMLLRQYATSFDHIEHAKRLLQTAPQRWLIPIMLIEGEVHLRAAWDVASPWDKTVRAERDHYDVGTTLLLKGYKLAKEHNHLRQQKRVRRLIVAWKHKRDLSPELMETLQKETENNKLDI